MRASRTSFLLSALFAHTVAADIFVVTHPQSPLKELSKNEISNLYLGKKQSFGLNERLFMLDQKQASSCRKKFYQQLSGMELSRVDAYWAMLHFSGNAQPPQAMSDDSAMLNLIRRNPLAIGYLEAPVPPEGVRVLLRLKDD